VTVALDHTQTQTLPVGFPYTRDQLVAQDLT